MRKVQVENRVFMRKSTRLSDAVHLLAFVQIVRDVHTRKGADPAPLLSSTAIARSIHTNPTYVRQLMSCMRKAGLLHSMQGQAKPSLARSATAISLLDIYRAVLGESPLLVLDTHINPLCHVGVGIQESLGEAYLCVQRKAEACMADISLADIIERFYAKVGNNMTLPL